MNISEPGRESEILIRRMVEEKREAWSLVPYTPVDDIATRVCDPDLHRPGLAFTGFVEKFSWERVQVIGESEWTYLDRQGPEGRARIFERYFGFAIPCVFVSKSLQPHPELLAAAAKKKVPVLGTPLSTVDIMNVIHTYLEDHFALHTSLHASLVDVYGVGMLYTGRAGIGKSECCLDLVERGHRLVADDIVHVVRRHDTIVGTGNQIIGHHMEIRGVGIIDVQSLFGIRAIRREKKIEVMVDLVDWSRDIDYERIGLEEKTVEVLGVPIQRVRVPVSPGKNITVISEVIAMNILLKMNGINPAKDFNQRLIQSLQERRDKKIEKTDGVE